MDYVSLRVSTLRGDQKISFNVYVKINEKMVLYLRRGDSFEGPRLQRLKEKKLKKMFILTEDETHYRDYLHNNIELAYDNKSGKDISVRSEIVHGQQQANVEEVFEKPEDAVAYQNTKTMAGKYVQFLLSNSTAVSSVMNMENVDKNLAHHGVSVSTLAVALADKLKTVSSEHTQILALGALLHDLGHLENQALITIPRNEMTTEQLSTYLKHPTVGADRVRDLKHFDNQVIRIIREHEECIDGSGFPNKLIEKKQDPLSVIVATCNALDRMISFENVPRSEVKKKIMVDRIGKHPLVHIQHLGEIIKDLLK
ncbi:MAG: HD domain-containing protein [Bdellovibrionaceae bacterium]|nr:HD domain-containing protein [Pseudobdellovibrionaceae bacterium]